MLQNPDRPAQDGADAAARPATLRLVHDAPAPRAPPAALASFVGREAELAAVAGALGHTRLLTLTGPGGAGKTRLAAEAARRASHAAADGVRWVELAPLGDGALVPGAVLAALGERPHAARPAAQQLEEALRGRELLLVLDNCEHVVGACAALAEALLLAAPGLRVLATSREPLRVPGEAVWPVAGLGVPAPDALRRGADPLGFPALRLFAERAAAATAAFRLTPANAEAAAAVCRQLDGLPLAIELAAARVRALTPAQIAARLGDALRLLATAPRTAEPRQQTLRATLDWSYELLDAPERVLLARLSVFAGGWTLASAEAVCADGDPSGGGASAALDAGAVLPRLAALVDRSLVVAEAVDAGAEGAAVRYRLLETVRQYAAERLDAAADADPTRRRHAEYFAAAAAAAARDYTRRRQEVVERLRPELENLRAALRWTRAHAPDTHVALAASLGWYFFALGLWAEEQQWLEGALDLPAARARGPIRARLLADLGYVANYRRATAQARAWLDEAAAIRAELGDGCGVASVQHVLGQIASVAGDRAAAAAALPTVDAAVATLRACPGRRLDLCWALASLGGVRSACGDVPGAAAALAESRGLARELDQPLSVAITSMGLALFALAGGDAAGAAALLRDALAAHRREPDYLFLSWTLQVVAAYAAATGAPGVAARLLGAHDALQEYAGAAATPGNADVGRARTEAAARGALGEAAFAAAVAGGRALTPAEMVALAEQVVAPPDGAGAAPADPPPLRIVSLGAVRVERAGAPVPLGEWRSAKARELLFYLLCHPAGRTREQIGVALWPEASAEQLRSAFHPVLHHLRRVLGDPGAVAHDGGVYRFAASRYEFDADAMERHLADAARAGADREAAAAALARAVALYGGDFLEQDPPAGDWHVARQDALRRRYDEALGRLGAVCLELGRHAEAADAFGRLLARDPLDEAAGRGLMRARAGAGDRREVARAYHRLADALRTELDAEPAAETTALFERLRGGAAA